ncbi:MAG: hypothetical protein F9K16_09725 [Thermoanaerobaculia bacterium]|nr:MAG: hypothetical protein F9K16_09725 [Thermoanaerobaculia bacterium]
MRASIQRLRSEGGFSLLELLIAMLIAIEILVAAAIAFDVHNRAAVVQTQITDLQQSLRVAQYDMARLVRMAGRGGLPPLQRPDFDFTPATHLLSGVAIEVRNNVTGGDRNIARGVVGSPLAVEGTDILTVRGCFANPVYQLEPDAFLPTDGSTPPDGIADGSVTFVVRPASVAGIPQPTEPLIEQLEVPGTNPLMVFLSPVSRLIYGVGRVTDYDDTGDLQITVDVTPGSAWESLDPWVDQPPAPPTRGMPAAMSAALTCVLEEYRYYVQQVHEIPGNAATPLRPRLTRARFEPGTEAAYAGDPANYALDLADGVFDLQIALGFDSDYPSVGGSAPGSFDDDLDVLGNDDLIFEAAAGTPGRATDDWLYNDSGDNPDADEWRRHQFLGRLPGQEVHLYYLRLTTVARTSRPDPSYQAPDFDTTVGSDWIEDHNYDLPPARDFKSEENRKFRRRMLTTVIEMRNI